MIFSRLHLTLSEAPHGYKKNAPFFISIFNGFDTCKKSLGKYSNGLEISIEEGDILSSGNLKKN